MASVRWNASADVDRVLTGHRVDDEERVVRGHGPGDQADLLHHLGVDGEAAGGVDDEHVAPEPAGLGEATGRGGDRVAGLREHRHVDALGERAQLLDRGRALQVGADEQRVAALGLEPAGELGGARGLAGALQTGHQHDRRRPTGVGDLERLAAEDPGELAVDDLDDLLAGIEGLRAGRSDRPRCGSGRRRRGRPSTLTSASSSAVRISFSISSTSASVRRPLPRTRWTMPSRRLDRFSNISQPGYRRPKVTVRSHG